MRTFAPGPNVVPSRRRSPWTASTAECGSVDASSVDRPSGMGRNARSGRQGELREAPLPGEQVGEHPVARLEPGHLRADGLHDPGHVRPDPRVAWPADPEDQSEEPRLGQDRVEIGAVDGCRLDTHEHPVAGGDGALDLADLDHVRRAVRLADRGLHGAGCHRRHDRTPPAGRRSELGDHRVGSRVIQYGVSGVGGVLNRAFATHSRPAANAIVVGTSTPVGVDPTGRTSVARTSRTGTRRPG